MRTGFRLAALGVALLTTAFWFFGGPNLGWTKTSAMRESTDAVTGQSVVTWEKHFQPGVDFLGAGLLASLALAGGSFLFRRPPPAAS
jgi:hypothetical protein